MTKEQASRTESELLDLLAERYPAPRYAFLPHVRNATGWGGVRTADAVVLELWPSDGLRLIGFELKSSRSDWLRELRRPVKREAVAQYCDQWYVVTGRQDIVRGGELPVGTGLIEAGPSGLRCAIPPLDVAPRVPERDFVAALVRRALSCSPHGRALEARAKELAQERVSALRRELHEAKVALARERQRLPRDPGPTPGA